MSQPSGREIDVPLTCWPFSFVGQPFVWLFQVRFWTFLRVFYESPRLTGHSCRRCILSFVSDCHSQDTSPRSLMKESGSHAYPVKSRTRAVSSSDYILIWVFQIRFELRLHWNVFGLQPHATVWSDVMQSNQKSEHEVGSNGVSVLKDLSFRVQSFFILYPKVN